MQELRYNTGQIIKAGILIAKRLKLTDPFNPIIGAQLNWYYWRYIIKADGGVIDIVNYNWNNIPNCAGWYFLTLPIISCNKLGSSVLYIFDSYSLEVPIFMEFNVITQNEWDSKYGDKYLRVEQDSKLG